MDQDSQSIGILFAIRKKKTSKMYIGTFNDTLSYACINLIAFRSIHAKFPSHCDHLFLFHCILKCIFIMTVSSLTFKQAPEDDFLPPPPPSQRFTVVTKESGLLISFSPLQLRNVPLQYTRLNAYALTRFVASIQVGKPIQRADCVPPGTKGTGNSAGVVNGGQVPIKKKETNYNYK